MKPANLQEIPSLIDLLQATALFLWKDWPRDMQVRLINNQSSQFSMTGTCPHCLREVLFVPIGSPFTENRGSGRIKVVTAMQCQGCMNFVLAIAIHLPNAGDLTYATHYPLGQPDEWVADEVPEHVKADFQEAIRCLWVKAYNATAEMCRRAVESACIDLGAPRNVVLEDMIDWLESQRKITPFLKDVAHKIRLGGNRGAHPTPQQPAAPVAPQPITKIEEDHADAIVKFTTEFFHHVYVVPKQMDKYDFSKPKIAKAKQP